MKTKADNAVDSARKFMRLHAWEFIDECGEVNCTRMAEEAAHFVDHDEWLDDETHQVWDMAVDVANIVEARRR